MPKLPDTSGQRVTPGFGGITPAYEAPAPAKIGDTISGLGGVLAKKKIEDDKYRVEDADTRLQQDMIRLSKGDDGFTRVKSGDVGEDFYNDYTARFDEASKNISETLRNDDQREAFDRRSSVRRLGYSENLINHTTKEQSAFQKQTFDGGVAAELDIASSDYDNPAVVKGSLLRTQKLSEAEADRLGLKGDARKILIKSNVSNLHEGVIIQANDDGNYQLAKSYFEKNQKNILGDRQDDIKRLLKAGGIKEQSQEEVDGYVNEGLSETEARAKARKLPSEVRDAALARVTARYSEANQIKDREQKAFGESAWSTYSDSIDNGVSSEDAYDLIPASVLDGMDGKERASLQNRAKLDAKGEDVPNGGADYYKLKLMARDDPKAFQEMNPLAYNLSESDRKQIINLQTDEKKLIISATKTQVMSRAAAGIGLEPKEATKDGSAGDKVRAFYKRVDQEIESLQASTGKEPSVKEIQEITERLSIDVIRERDYWWNTEIAAGIIEVEGVPSYMVDELALRLSRDGTEVTENNILAEYKSLQQK